MSDYSPFSSESGDNHSQYSATDDRSYETGTISTYHREDDTELGMEIEPSLDSDASRVYRADAPSYVAREPEQPETAPTGNAGGIEEESPTKAAPPSRPEQADEEGFQEDFEAVLNQTNSQQQYDGSSHMVITRVVDERDVEEQIKFTEIWRDHRCPICIICIAILLITASVVLGVLLSGVAESSTKSILSPTTMAPTPTQVFELPNYTLQAIEENPDGPQARAYDWLMEDSEEQNEGEVLSSQRLMQRFALATLYYAAEGETWTDSTNWLTSEHECNWFSSANNDDDDKATPCGSSSGVLSQLILSNNNVTTITSGLPLELFLLSNLRNLDLSENSITGTLPTQVSQLTELERLRLGRNQMMGTLPTEVGALTALEVLSVYTNGFVGPLPTSLGDASRLTQIWVSSNKFHSSLPSELGMLSELQIAWLDQNKFSNQLPSELGGLSQLQDIMLHENDVTGTLPTELGLLGSTLVKMDVRSNDLTGSLPTEIGMWTNLESLVLHQNKMTGQLPSEIGNLVQLTNLYASSNRFTGSIPSTLGNCENLQILWLLYNQLSSSIPSELGQLALVGDLLLSRNVLVGSIPSEFGNMSSLHTLALQQNAGLTGNIPTELASVRTLTKVTLSRTGMSGAIPEEVCTPLEDALVFDCSATFCGCSDCACPA